MEATQTAHRPMAYNHNTGQMLHMAGFVDIQETAIRVPINPWHTVQEQTNLGRWCNLNMIQGLEAMTLAPLYRVLNWRKEEIDQLIAETRTAMCSRKNHVYNVM